MAEYIALSSALNIAILIMEFLEEFTNKEYNLISFAPKANVKTVEEKSGALEITHLTRICSHTIAINVIYHHFHEYV